MRKLLDVDFVWYLPGMFGTLKVLHTGYKLQKRWYYLPIKFELFLCRAWLSNPIWRCAGQEFSYRVSPS
jgi:hypothetical protein